MMTVPLYGDKAAGRVALVDDGDRDLVMSYRWTIWETPDSGPYATTNRRGGRGVARAILMHQMLTGYPLTDHRDRNGLNNQRANLRVATYSQNIANQRKRPGCASPYKGVTWHPATGKWRARVKAGGKTRSLGLFASEVDAALAYDAAARRIFGEYACLNFP